MDLPIAKHEELVADGKLSRRKSDDYWVSTKVQEKYSGFGVILVYDMNKHKVCIYMYNCIIIIVFGMIIIIRNLPQSFQQKR